MTALERPACLDRNEERNPAYTHTSTTRTIHVIKSTVQPTNSSASSPQSVSLAGSGTNEKIAVTNQSSSWQDLGQTMLMLMLPLLLLRLALSKSPAKMLLVIRLSIFMKSSNKTLDLSFGRPCLDSQINYRMSLLTPAVKSTLP